MPITRAVAAQQPFRYVKGKSGVRMPRAGNDARDGERLRTAAAELINALEKSKGPGKRLEFKRSLRPVKTDTDGWAVAVAKMGPGLPDLEVFLDRFAGGDGRHFWFGFFAGRLTHIAKVFDACPSISPRQIEDVDVIKTGGGNIILKKSLTKLEAAEPIVELYSKDRAFFFGIYDLVDTSGDIKRAVRFLVPIIRSLQIGPIQPDYTLEIERRQYGFFRRLNRDRQQRFRSAVLQAYGGACALTCCHVKECLEATHLDRYADGSDNRATNGILLRADLHRLMDAGLLTFLWSQEKVTAKVDPSVKEKAYRDLHGAAIRLPEVQSCRPSKECIERHASKWVLRNS